MTELPDKEKAKETLFRVGYVRLGDHSASNLRELEEIYHRRHAAWEAAEKRLFTPPPTLPGDPGVPPPGPAIQPSMPLPAVPEMPVEPTGKAKPSKAVE